MPKKTVKKYTGAFEAVALRTDDQDGTVSVGTSLPHFSWKMNHHAGSMQSAYRIQAASAVELLDSPDFWDSGWIESEQSVGIPWNGKVLRSRQRVFWRVMLRDREGKVSEPSAPAEFEVALLHNSDWKARWIRSDFNIPACPTPCPYFRREFVLRKNIERAVLYVTARGLFEARINGKRVGDDHFVPGWTDFRKQIQYLSYDVTSLLRKGKNAAGAILGDGWYCGYLSARRLRNIYGDNPELLFQLEIRYKDGSFEQILSGKEWKWSTGPILSSDIYDGEQYDSRLEMPGWDRPGFDDSKWREVTPGEPASESPALVRKRCPAVRHIMELKPVKILNPQKGIFIWDFGQNITGRMRVRLKGNPGCVYSFHFGEMLNPDGTLYTLNYRSARSTDYYACSGNRLEPEEWEPLFTFHGFRYLQINGFQYSGAELEDVDPVALVMHSGMAVTGSFECGVPKVNRLYSNICWGQRDNFLEVPTDCPQRDERLGWTGDADVFAAAAAFNMDVKAFFHKWLRDLREAQRPDGAVPSIVPNVYGSRAAWGAAVWADAAVRIPWILYQRYAGLSILRESFDSMKKWVDYQKNTSNRLIRPKTAFGDWLALSAVETPSELIGTALFAESARIVGKAAALLGKKREAAFYRRLSGQVKAAFRNEFLDARGLLKIKSQTACVLAIRFDLLTPEQLRKNAALLVRLIRKNGNKLSTGFVGTAWLTSALSKSGNTGTAYDLLLQEEYPSWLFSVDQGATTTWERWNSYTVKDGFGDPNMNSFNHYAYGAVAEWMAATAGGIRFDDDRPGGKLLIFAAQPDRRLKHVSCSLETPYGKAESCWKFSGKSWVWRIAAPCSTELKVILPKFRARKVTLNGKAVSQPEFRLENGVYEIRMDLN